MRGRYGQVLGLYLQTMLAADAPFTMSVGTITRYRPFLYGTQGGGDRNSKISANSFFAGHTAHTAAATFFAAKVYHDFHPDSRLQPFVWTAAAVVPTVEGNTRLKAGKHFLSDIIVGYVVDATAGIVVPHLHNKSNDLSVLPTQGLNMNGHAYSGSSLAKRL